MAQFTGKEQSWDTPCAVARNRRTPFAPRYCHFRPLCVARLQSVGDALDLRPVEDWGYFGMVRVDTTSNSIFPIRDKRHRIVRVPETGYHVDRFFEDCILPIVLVKTANVGATKPAARADI
jgi:hypothetical protein